MRKTMHNLATLLDQNSEHVSLNSMFMYTVLETYLSHKKKTLDFENNFKNIWEIINFMKISKNRFSQIKQF